MIITDETTPIIEPHRTWRLVEQRLVGEADPRRRQILEVTLDHMNAEATADWERLIGTLAPNPEYHTWGSSPADNGPKGLDGVMAFYQAFLDAGCDVLHHDITRIIADEHGVVTEGEMRIAYPGWVVAARGIDVPEVEAYYLYQCRMLIVWEYDENAKLLCEDSYTTGDGFATLRRIEDHELPAVLADRLAARAAR